MVKRFILGMLLLFVADVLVAQTSVPTDSVINYIDINGLKQGKWEKKDLNGKLRFEAYFIDDKPVGDFKRFDENGNLYAWLKYNNQGEKASVTFYHKTGKTAATGKYIGKAQDSIWNYFDEDGGLYLQESYNNGVKNGQFKQYTSEGVMIEEVSWKNGVKDGPWKKFYVEGQKMWDATYVNGKLEGPFKSWYKNGGLQKEGVYVNDFEEGDWKAYSEAGNLLKTYHYKNGVSPEADAEKENMLKELDEEKGKLDDPVEHIDDPDWFRKQSH